MKTATLYLRVSTDEQALHGFSLGCQEDILRRHCLQNDIQIKSVVSENYSAKTFNRPQWLMFIAGLKKDKQCRPDYLLFTQWDRFSRNAADAYPMITVLQKLGVIPQAVQQPLDLAIPENKITLAFYLVAPEVENDRRSINAKTALRKAKIEGRWIGPAPMGYRNSVSGLGQKCIIKREPEASLLKEVFEQIAEKQFNICQVYRMVTAKGLNCSLTNFCRLLRNPVYAAKSCSRSR